VGGTCSSPLNCLDAVWEKVVNDQEPKIVCQQLGDQLGGVSREECQNNCNAFRVVRDEWKLPRMYGANGDKAGYAGIPTSQEKGLTLMGCWEKAVTFNLKFFSFRPITHT